MSNERNVAKTEQAINVSEMLEKLDEAEAIIKDVVEKEESDRAIQILQTVVDQAKADLPYEADRMQSNIAFYKEGQSGNLGLLIAILFFREAIKEKWADQKELKSEESCNPQETNDGIQVFDAGGCTVFAPAGVNIRVTKVII